jgi:hypothetical protein
MQSEAPAHTIRAGRRAKRTARQMKRPKNPLLPSKPSNGDSASDRRSECPPDEARPHVISERGSSSISWQESEPVHVQQDQGNALNMMAVSGLAGIDSAERCERDVKADHISHQYRHQWKPRWADDETAPRCAGNGKSSNRGAPAPRSQNAALLRVAPVDMRIADRQLRFLTRLISHFSYHFLEEATRSDPSRESVTRKSRSASKL